MPSHLETTVAFHKGLFDGTLPPGITATGDVTARFGVYRNTVLHGLTEALRTRYGTINTLVGHDFFTAMGRVFIENNPPTSPVMQDYGAGFPGFLRRFPPVRHLPYLPDVARLERLRGLAYHAADAVPLTATDLTEAVTTNGRLHLHPSVHVFTSQTPAVSIWQAHHAAQAGQITAGAEQALIARDTAFVVRVFAMTQAQLAFCETLMRSGVLAAALAQAQLAVRGAFDPTSTLALLFGSGLFVQEPSPC